MNVLNYLKKFLILFLKENHGIKVTKILHLKKNKNRLENTDQLFTGGKYSSEELVKCFEKHFEGNMMYSISSTKVINFRKILTF